MSVVDLNLRSIAGGFRSMDKLKTPGMRVRFRLAGPARERLGEVVHGWMARDRSGARVYWTWDRWARANVLITPTGWAPLPETTTGPRAA